MNEKQTALVVVNEQIKEVAAGTLLSEVLHMEKPCGGRGACGKCKVIAKGMISELSEAEKKHLTADELASGVRLACMTRVLGDCTVEMLTGRTNAQIVIDGLLPQIERNPAFSQYGVAIDIGTTTLAARMYDVKGKLLSEAVCSNPQSKWGADVISRIEAAIGGQADALADTIRSALDGMIVELVQKVDVAPQAIDGLVVTGNTVMLSLLTKESVEPFSHAPFDVRELFGKTVTARELSLSSLDPDTRIYLPPCTSAFVGADITCAILASGLCDGQEPAILADIGTNGEMALWHNGELTVCSTAAGPAFEGVGISMGMRGETGAIDRVVTRDGFLHAHVIGEGMPKGICGSGLIDAVACMLEIKAVDESGYLEDEPVVISGNVSLTQEDIRMLQLAKSAICAGMVTFVKEAGLRSHEVKRLLVAGGFGYYLNPKSAGAIGLWPCALSAQSQAIGNAALGGAVMLLLNASMCSVAEKIASCAHTLELSTSTVFAQTYIDGMMLAEIGDE